MFCNTLFHNAAHRHVPCASSVRVGQVDRKILPQEPQLNSLRQQTEHPSHPRWSQVLLDELRGYSCEDFSARCAWSIAWGYSPITSQRLTGSNSTGWSDNGCVTMVFVIPVFVCPVDTNNPDGLVAQIRLTDWKWFKWHYRRHDGMKNWKQSEESGPPSRDKSWGFPPHKP